MGIQINGITDTISATDGGLAVSGQQLTGVTDINASGIVTATQGYVVGTGASIFSPAANTLALGTNGSERIRITSAGLVGIGVLSPSSVLDLNGSLSISGKTTDVGAARITHHTNNYFYVRGGTAGAILSDQAGNNTVRVENSGSILFETNNGSERARIDSSGRLLVGTSSGQGDALLQVQGLVGSAAGWGILRLSRGLNTAAIGGNVGARLGDIDFGANDGTVAASIRCVSDATWSSTSDTPGALTFLTTADGASSPTERMRIDSNGNLNLGANAFTARLNVYSATNSLTNYVENARNISGDTAAQFILGSNTNNTSSYFLQCVTAAVGAKFYIYGNGTFGTVSDVNLKKNIEGTRNGYLDDIQKLRVVKYNWKTDNDDAPKELGWIAQELAEVFPGLVQDSQPDPDGNTVKEVKTSVLPFILLKALQEAAEQIKDLQAEVDALKAQ